MFVCSDDLEFPRSWLIPVIRDHVKNTQLAYFTSYFFPLANKLKQTGMYQSTHIHWFHVEMSCGVSITVLNYMLIYAMCHDFCSDISADEQEQSGQKLMAKVYQTLQMQVR